ncbi:MAG: undecaprenyl-diphosphate phosphatase, partial [Bdellovibrionota bacterium]
MTTFQAIILGIIGGFSEFLPVGAGLHHKIAPFFLGWPELTGPALGAVALGTFLSAMIYYRHDWASILSSLLQVILFRKKPMTLDERLPFFLFLTTLPTLAARVYLTDLLPPQLLTNMLVSAIILGLFALPLLFLDSWSRKNRGMFDW